VELVAAPRSDCLLGRFAIESCHRSFLPQQLWKTKELERATGKKKGKQYMATKSKTNRRHNQSHQQPHGMNGPEMADKARRNYEQAIRTGQRLQEEAGQWWTRLLSQTATATDWQRGFSKFTSLAGNAMPIAQRCLEGTMDVMEKSGRASADLMKRAVDAAQTASPAECQTKWMEFWTASMRATQSNVEAVTQLSTKTIDSWIDFVRKNSDAGEVHIPRAA
jgi:hypothetical protein